MARKIQNLTDRKVLVRLSSGETLHIAPRGTSAELSDVEVQNAKVRKLQDGRVISLETTGGRSAARSSRAKSESQGQ